jgi:hypothetical protein
MKSYKIVVKVPAASQEEALQIMEMYNPRPHRESRSTGIINTAPRWKVNDPVIIDINPSHIPQYARQLGIKLRAKQVQVIEDNTIKVLTKVTRYELEETEADSQTDESRL